MHRQNEETRIASQVEGWGPQERQSKECALNKGGVLLCWGGEKRKSQQTPNKCCCVLNTASIFTFSTYNVLKHYFITESHLIL